MKKDIFNEYGIDIKYELRTYIHVGRDYNKKSFCGKYKNRNEKRYKFCNKYSDWEKHMRDIIPSQILNHNDMLHWLYDKKQETYELLECIRIILVPIYVAFFTVLMSFFNDSYLTGDNIIFTMIGPMFIIVMVSTIVLKGTMVKFDFFDNFIEIMEKYIDDISHQK